MTKWHRRPKAEINPMIRKRHTISSTLPGLVVFLGIVCEVGVGQEPKPTTAELAASSGVTPCTGTDVSERECEKRDTARLFLLMGKPEAALRILCNTRSAIEVFRPGGALGSDKYEDNAAGNAVCLKSVGLEPVAQAKN